MQHLLLSLLWIYSSGINSVSPQKSLPVMGNLSGSINWWTINATGVVFSQNNDNLYSLSGCIPQSPIGIIEPDGLFGIISGFWSSECEITFKAPKERDPLLLSQKPLIFKLHQNFPNPFTKTTKIIYDLPTRSTVSINIYDISGRQVRRLINNQQQEAGQYILNWDGRDEDGKKCASGIYFYFIKTETQKDVKKMLIAR